ncbi:hypothetical protein EVAR_100660_1 [Eumeta japonica]|uniref:Uncharacterized protein n=1 Tax=Eumeta variegata TaxID=151549 RepID=A0A4C1ZL58_EUMVA|nr:hypothetical protein EVAR_100660_1 [Eumeta japonica]
MLVLSFEGSKGSLPPIRPQHPGPSVFEGILLKSEDSQSTSSAPRQDDGFPCFSRRAPAAGPLSRVTAHLKGRLALSASDKTPDVALSALSQSHRHYASPSKIVH